MNSEFRRSARYADFLPITVSVVGKNQEKVAGAISGRIVNISNHGACLLLTRVMLNSFHIFHSTREDEACSLTLHIPLCQDKKDLEIKTHPVWLNTVHMEDLKVFKMGVDFIDPLDQYQLKKINKLLREL